MYASPSTALLAELIGFSTVSRTSNLALIDHVQGLMEAHGIACTRVTSEDGTRSNLFASTGPSGVPGVMLSGHTDVVPTEGQAWSSPPFVARTADGRIYGRGSADMKGFVACAVQAMVAASALPLKQPLQLALSYDEEIGCVGVRRLIELLAASPVRPRLCIVGEPTSMQIATGHKGKLALRAVCCGREGHSALAPQALNAIHLAADFINALRDTQHALATDGARDEAYDVPYSTVHVGTVQGGTALNIVPNRCTLDFEIRHLQQDDPAALLAGLVGQADAIGRRERARFPESAIDIETVNAYPGLDLPVTADAVGFLESLLPAGTGTTKVAFGTEAGLFTRALATPVVVCGPGSMDQGHKPDEYVELAQMQACDAFLDRLSRALCA